MRFFKSIFKKKEDVEEIQETQELQEPEVVEIVEIIEDATPEKIENKLYTVEEKQGFFQKLVKGLSKTKSNIIGNIDNLLKGFTKIDEELFEELEEQLIMADIGVSATTAIIADMRQKAKDGRLKEPSQIKSLLKEEIIKILNTSNKEKILDDNQKKVIL
ncbi:MAG TPA: signal recognition particle-docking protein FtsY, partial [Clostridiales bacterium]|nr:signal recognition particle-docking protein FtsY [Clostridiales bacterium]